VIRLLPCLILRAVIIGRREIDRHERCTVGDPKLLKDLIKMHFDRMVDSLPQAAYAMFRLMLELLTAFDGKIADLDREIARRAREDEVSRRLTTIPGIGPISTTAIAALAPPAETFTKGRDFAAWLGSLSLHHQRPDRWQHPTTCRSS